MILAELERRAVPALGEERLLPLVDHKSFGVWPYLAKEFPRLVGGYSVALLPDTTLTAVDIFFSSTLLAAAAFLCLGDNVFYFRLLSREFNG